MSYTVRHIVNSKLLSVDDDPAAQCFDDYGLICQALTIAAGTDLSHIDNPFANAFPGDHYRLLAGLLTSLRPECVVDVGTHMGTGTRVMYDFAKKAKIHTFDLTPWHEFDKTFLEKGDFVQNGGRLTQYLADLTEPDNFQKFSALLQQADFIMVDACKDGVFEEKFYSLLSSLNMESKTRYMLLDDIRFTSELINWRRIESPKIDLTSFGHFTGTGLVDISKGFKFLH